MRSIAFELSVLVLNFSLVDSGYQRSTAMQDVNTTSLQVDARGKVPCPARVGRDDVAELAISAVMFQAENVTVCTEEETNSAQTAPLKMSLGVRWVGEEMHPYPAQGTKRDGLRDAHQCMNKALREHKLNQKRKRRRANLQKTSSNVPASIARYASSRRRSIKPYGVFVAIPVYFLLWVMLRNACHYIPGFNEKVAPALARIRDTVGAAVMARVPTIRRSIRRILKKGGGKSYLSL